MSSAGYLSTLKVSGASTAMTAEACTDLGGDVFQVTDADRRIIDPSVAITVKDGGVAVDAADYSFDYLYGKITFSSAPAGAVTLDANFLTPLAVAEVRKASLSGTRAQLDDTVWGGAGLPFRKYKDGQLDWGGSAEMLAQPTDDLDGGTGGTQSFFEFLKNGTPKLLEVYRAGKTWRGWVNIESIENASELEGLVTASIGYKGSAQASTGAALAFE